MLSVSSKNLLITFLALLTFTCPAIFSFASYTSFSTTSYWSPYTTTTVCHDPFGWDAWLFTPYCRTSYVTIPQIVLTKEIEPVEPSTIGTYCVCTRIEFKDKGKHTCLRKTLSADNLEELIEKTQDHVLNSCEGIQRAKINLEFRTIDADTNRIKAISTSSLVWGRRTIRIRPFKNNQEYICHKIATKCEQAFIKDQPQDQTFLYCLAIGLGVLNALLFPSPPSRPVYVETRSVVYHPAPLFFY